MTSSIVDRGYDEIKRIVCNTVYLEWPSFPVIVTADILMSFVGDTLSRQI